MSTSTLLKDPQWYKDAIIYELHVRSFYDSNNDGIGDFRGVIKKLEYLEGLGVTALWLLPFYPSPLRDDGYDIADYFKINPDYGTLKDFKEFIRAAHRRGIRVITEIVLNHTSNEHPWFQRAKLAEPGSAARNFYVWSETPEKYADARIIFKDFETSNWSWDATARAYYWHRFYSHQPDLNFENPQVQKELLRAVDFWLDMGVDGLRLDAVPYLFEAEGTNCENLPETHAFLKKLRKHVDEKYKNKMLLAEANQWPEDACAYFGDGDECHVAFHFPLMPRMFMAVQMEDSFPIIDILKSTPAIPELCQWAIFLRNHDELTLEMVTDEERDYMYRSYVRDPRAKINIGIRRRLAPLLENNRRKIELMTILLFSLPGTPVLYYGDEIGMGDNYYLGDRNGVRTPMQWMPDRNAGFSNVNPQQLFLPVIIDPDYHYESINVEHQERNLSSLLWWMKRLISIRKQHKAFSRGTIEMLSSDNMKVLTFSRTFENETILVVANLSRFSQVVSLNVPQYFGYVPEEILSQNQFPPIRKKPYPITLGPYTHFWLLLKKEKDIVHIKEDKEIPEVSAPKDWQDIFKDTIRKRIEEKVLPQFLQRCRWFGGKSKSIRSVRIIEDIPVAKDSSLTHLLFLEVNYHIGTTERYHLPVSFTSGDHKQHIIDEYPQSIITYIQAQDTTGILYDGVYDEAFRAALFAGVSQRKKLKGKKGILIGETGKKFKAYFPTRKEEVSSQVLSGEQSNTSVLYDKTGILKLYRRINEGINPDLEISRHLTERTSFEHTPPYLGSLEYVAKGMPSCALGLIQGFVENTGDGWTYALDAVRKYYEYILSKDGKLCVPSELASPLAEEAELPPCIHEFIDGYFLDMIALLGTRTAELHLALSSIKDNQDFIPEPFSMLYQRSVYQSVQSQSRRILHLLAEKARKLPKGLRVMAEEIAGSEQRILNVVNPILKKKIGSLKIRIHGDYHLGQVLFTGNDFIIIDFEGEPIRPLSERRLKYSPFRDVASMIRSFHYAAYGGLFLKSTLRKGDIPYLQEWAEPWYRCVRHVFLRAYLKTAGDSQFVPKSREETAILLNTLLLNKAIYEIGYELDNRPEWLVIPMKGVQQIIGNQ